MTTRYNNMNSFETTNTIVVNGQKMSIKEFNELKKQKNTQKQKKRKTKKVYIEIENDYKDNDTLKEDIKNLIKKVSPFKSLNVFYSHAYRSYGKVSEEIMKPYQREYTKFRTRYREVEKQLDEIQTIKTNESEIYDATTKLAWKVDDMKNALVNLLNKVKEHKQITKRLFEGQPIYDGRMLGGKTPRELGFKHQLFMKSPIYIDKVITDLEKACKKLNEWAKKGKDPLTYKI